MRLQLEDDVQEVHQEKHLEQSDQDLHKLDAWTLTILVPRLTFREYLSAFALLAHDAWKAVGRSKLVTLKLNRQALICVTVLL